MSFATKPTFVKQAFANNGIKNTIPDITTNEGYASYDKGFPDITMQPKESGGLPPRGQDMNGILNELSQFNQYQQMGGTYGLDNNILKNGGYAKNSVVYQDDGIYRSLVDNNTDNFVNNPSAIDSTWQLIVDYNSQSGTNGVPGQLSYFARTDIPTGWLRCDGAQYTKASFPNFWDDYLTQNKMPTCSYAEYATEISDNNGNCGKFAVDLVKLTFKVPTIQGQVFISQALSSGDIGKFNAESLPNIKGSFEDVQNAKKGVSTGAFSDDQKIFGYGVGGGTSVYAGTETFDASRSSSAYKNGAIVQPNNIQFPIFVCVANVQVPVSEAQYNGFISNLTQKVDTDGSNAGFGNLSATAKENITNLVGLKKINEFNIEDGDSEIIINNINSADLHKFLFGKLEVNQASYLCYQLSIDNGTTWLSNNKYFDAGITFKSNNYANNAYTDNSPVGILTNDGQQYLIQPYDGNSCFGEVNFNDLRNNSLSKKANINFTYNTEVSANGIQCVFTACAGYYDKVSCNAIRFFLSSGTFKSGKIKYYTMN